ncbi:hypothetical protein DFQ27_006849, partial [Actinomortierella ambigua]
GINGAGMSIYWFKNEEALNASEIQHQLNSKFTKLLAIEYIDRMLRFQPMVEWRNAALEEPYSLDWDEIYPLYPLKSLQRAEE